jgi:hypothetical protein
MKFGLVVPRHTGNLGDEIQAIAVERLLPRVDHWLERDDLGSFAAAEPVAAVVSGWFGFTPENWPPAPDIVPLLTSFHMSATVGEGPSGLSAREVMLREPWVGYLRRCGPVGARDLETLHLLEAAGIESYFSGCLSLTLRPGGLPRGEAVVLNEVPAEVLAYVRARTTRPIVETGHIDKATPFGKPRLAKAHALLEIYERAHCVVTTRLHCALPCLALGTPVVLLDVAPDRGRFSGLQDYLRHHTVPAFLGWPGHLDYDRPEPNREDFRKLADPLRRRVAEFVDRVAAGGAPAVDRAIAVEERLNGLAVLNAEARRRIGELEAELAAARQPAPGPLSRLWRRLTGG